MGGGSIIGRKKDADPSGGKKQGGRRLFTSNEVVEGPNGVMVIWVRNGRRPVLRDLERRGMYADW